MQAWQITMQDEVRHCLLSSKSRCEACKSSLNTAIFAELKYLLQAGQDSEASPELAEAAAAAAS